MELYVPRNSANNDSMIEMPRIIEDSLNAERDTGRIDGDVQVKIGSTSVTRDGRHWRITFDIGVNREPRDGEGRRRVNSYGHPVRGGFTASGTFDEYGWILARLFDVFPSMIVGRPAQPIYADRADFAHKTGVTYFPVELLEFIERTLNDPYPYLTMRSTNGSRGKGRSDGEGIPRYMLTAAIESYANDTRNPYRSVTFAPRDPGEIRAFAKLNVNGAPA